MGHARSRSAVSCSDVSSSPRSCAAIASVSSRCHQSGDSSSAIDRIPPPTLLLSCQPMPCPDLLPAKPDSMRYEISPVLQLTQDARCEDRLLPVLEQLHKLRCIVV